MASMTSSASPRRLARRLIPFEVRRRMVGLVRLPRWFVEHPSMAREKLCPRAYTFLCAHPLLYHSRLLPSQVGAMFERAGFRRIAVRSMILPSGTHVDSDKEALAGHPAIERARLAAPFRDASEADLGTAAAHYLFRKPNPTPP
jgi:hypothetical protein